jgi:hypothetical protein
MNKYSEPIVTSEHLHHPSNTSNDNQASSRGSSGGERGNQSLIFHAPESILGNRTDSTEETYPSPSARVRSDVGCADKAAKMGAGGDGLCIVCTEQEADAVLLECGHGCARWTILCYWRSNRRSCKASRIAVCKGAYAQIGGWTMDWLRDAIGVVAAGALEGALRFEKGM